MSRFIPLPFLALRQDALPCFAHQRPTLSYSFTQRIARTHASSRNLRGLHLCHSLVSFSPFIHSSAHPFIYPFITNPLVVHIYHTQSTHRTQIMQDRLPSTCSFASILLLSSPKIIYLNPNINEQHCNQTFWCSKWKSVLCRSTTGRTLLTNYGIMSMNSVEPRSSW